MATFAEASQRVPTSFLPKWLGSFDGDIGAGRGRAYPPYGLFIGRDESVGLGSRNHPVGLRSGRPRVNRSTAAATGMTAPQP